MNIEQLKETVSKNQKDYPGWGFYDHTTGISVSIKSGRYYFYYDNKQISKSKAEEIIKRGSGPKGRS